MERCKDSVDWLPTRMGYLPHGLPPPYIYGLTPPSIWATSPIRADSSVYIYIGYLPHPYVLTPHVECYWPLLKLLWEPACLPHSADSQVLPPVGKETAFEKQNVKGCITYCLMWILVFRPGNKIYSLLHYKHFFFPSSQPAGGRSQWERAFRSKQRAIRFRDSGFDPFSDTSQFPLTPLIQYQFLRYYSKGAEPRGNED